MYGRPPASWLVSESLKKYKEATFRDVARATKTPILAVRKLSENYADFLRLKHVVDESMLVSTAIVNVKRLAHLHAILAADRVVRIQIGRYEAGHPHTLAEAFAKFLVAARRAGLRTKMKTPRMPSKIIETREAVLAKLKIPY
jgi:imidazolonepropionase-like amidohydrolase